MNLQYNFHGVRANKSIGQPTLELIEMFDMISLFEIIFFPPRTRSFLEQRTPCSPSKGNRVQ